MESQAHTGEVKHAEGHGYRVYAVTWLWLLLVTLALVGISLLEIPGVLKVLVVAGGAIFKAVLIMAYFMHLRFERKTLTYLIALPMILIVVLYFALLPDARLF
jgi:cytochrome c oxidase subunit 4